VATSANPRQPPLNRSSRPPEAYRDSRRPHFLGGWGLSDLPGFLGPV